MICVLIFDTNKISMFISYISKWSLASEEDYKSKRYDLWFVLFFDHMFISKISTYVDVCVHNQALSGQFGP